MRPKLLLETIKFVIEHRLPLLIKGAPGLGKSSIVDQACIATNTELIISHPVVSDPTDYKGLPFPVKGKKENGKGKKGDTEEIEEAKFLPFGDLLRLIKATKPTVFFLDDLGQAPASVQAACMQLLLARKINGHKVADCVTFLAATNRRQDKAGVMGILEPVKSRFAAIVELEINIDDWVNWAIESNMPVELIAFIRYRPNLLHDFKPTADIINTPNPRTVAYVGKMMKVGLSDNIQYEMISGAAGEGFAAEFIGFLNTWKNLPDIENLIQRPETTAVPTEPSLLFAICGALIQKADMRNIEMIMKYMVKMPAEFQVLFLKDAIKKKPALAETSAFLDWSRKHHNLII